METHFLAGLMDGTPSFRAEPWYNADGDCLVFKVADEAAVADRIDELLTLYRSAVDDRVIGFQVKGVAAIIRKFGLAGLTVSSQGNAGEVGAVSITALLLAAYGHERPTVHRRRNYATALQFEGAMRTLALDEIPVGA